MNIDITYVKLEVYTPENCVVAIRDALTKIGACKIGNYDYVVSYHNTKGYWKPLEDSNPFNGTKEEICFGHEVKMELRCPIEILEEALQGIKEIHPYEEPVINIIPLMNAL